MSKLKAELLEATGIADRKPKEALQTFLKRAMVAVGGLDEAEWDKLSDPGVQSWYNQCVDAQSAKKDLPDFADAEPDGDDKAKAKPGAKANGAKTKAAPAEKKKAADGEKKEKAPRAAIKGAEYWIIAHAIKHPKADADDISKVLKDKGLKAQPSTVKLQLNRTRRVLAIQEELA